MVDEGGRSLGEFQQFNDKIDFIYQAQNHQNLKSLPYMEHTQTRSVNIMEEEEESDEGQTLNDDEQPYDPKTDMELMRTLRSSLDQAGFKAISQRDLDLCNALNDGYLLRLSIAPDVMEFDPSIGRDFANCVKENDDGDGKNNNDIGRRRRADGNINIESENGEDEDSKLEKSLEELLFEGRILVFRRGYSSELTRGRLLLPKLDYLQSSIVQRSAARLARRIASIDQAINDSLTQAVNDVQKRATNALKWNEWKGAVVDKVKNVSDTVVDQVNVVDAKLNSTQVGTKMNVTTTVNELLKDKYNVNVSSISDLAQQQADKGVDILKDATDKALNKTAKSLVQSIREKGRAQKIRLGRYAGRTTASSEAQVRNQETSDEFTYAGAGGANAGVVNVDDSLAPFLMCNIISGMEKDAKVSSSYDLVSPIREPPINLLDRVSISNLVDLFSTGGRRRLFKSIFSTSELVEPTYEEVVLVWRPLPEKPKKKKSRKFRPRLPKWIYDTAEIFDVEDRLPEIPKEPLAPAPLPIEIRTFDRVPMANLLAVLPKTKLIFRPADALIFDLVNAFSLLAVLASQKFDSPKLDLIALVSVCLYGIRTFFRYSNKLARYDLLVNKFLTKRISHRNTGALRYIAGEAGTQRARRTSMVHEWLLGYGTSEAKTEWPLREEIIQIGPMEVNKLLEMDVDQPVSIDIEAALEDLILLDLIIFDDNDRLSKVLTGEHANASLSTLWNDVFDGKGAISERT
eukprot:CAMPEP_0194128292 /NCGR_PEP_ID=MMETSP0150-20130528/60972_1 /TAXON_ID=122233 /ORGANISM="Chaetoceros debilis, Strain MM31A-1" /LENGTH=742 /DNA_ID=CAMNT_0038822271 /DNA_START=712 /DNA_END=2940 /DNA_ORIENTATION=+